MDSNQQIKTRVLQQIQLKLTMAFCAIFLFVIVPNGYAQSISDAAIKRHAALLQKAKDNDEVDIIISSKLYENPQVNKGADAPIGSMTADTLMSLQQDVYHEQRQLMEKMPAYMVKKSKAFRYSAQVAMRVDQEMLEILLQDENIEVYEDKLNKPQLDSSVPLIFPDYDTSPYNGSDEWSIAILDTGVDSAHEFLQYEGQSKLLAEACFSNGTGDSAITTSLCPDGALSSTAVGSGQPCTLAGCEHGTYVAGIAVGHSNALSGVAQRGQYISIQIYSQVNDEDFCFPDASCLGARDSDMIEALEYVFSLRNTYDIGAVNISAGSGRETGSCDDDPRQPIIDQLRQAGIATIVSVGNDGYDSEISSPACVTSAIAVGATSLVDAQPAEYSNNGAMLDFYAPGTSVNSSVPNGLYEVSTGTSAAAAHVSGAWLAAKSAYPDASVDIIEQAFKDFGPDVADLGIVRKRIDVSSTVAYLADLKPDASSDDCDYYIIGAAVICL